MTTAFKFITTVDDDPDFTEAMEATLKQASPNYIIEQINSGAEFMIRLENQDRHLDIAIIDIQMPNFSVTECVKKIQKFFPAAYVVVVSANHDVDFITTLFNEHHIWGYVIKAHDSFSQKLLRLVKEAEEKLDILRTLRDGRKH